MSPPVCPKTCLCLEAVGHLPLILLLLLQPELPDLVRRGGEESGSVGGRGVKGTEGLDSGEEPEGGRTESLGEDGVNGTGPCGPVSWMPSLQCPPPCTCLQVVVRVIVGG